MKNEAPENFYTDENGNNPLLKRHCDSDMEYIRTDVFIEKAVDYIANNMRCDGYTFQTKAKFIKEFRTYLKGE